MSDAPRGRLRYLLPLVGTVALAGCTYEEFTLGSGAFVGELTGFVEQYDGSVVALLIEVQRETVEAQRFTFSGTAAFDGVEYHVEGEEWIDATGYTYQLAPAPSGYVEASLYREVPDPVYAISARVHYGCTVGKPCRPVVEGTLRRGEEPVGSVRLRATE